MPLPTPELEAGSLDKYVTLLKPVYNEWQDEIPSWEAYAQTWAAIHPAVAQETSDAGRMVSSTHVPITIRYRTDIDARWRIQDGPHMYEVITIADPERRRARLDMVCREVI